jgi:hypothetical protein
MRRIFECFGVIFICLFIISSCSMRKLIVRNLDWFLMQEMDAYFDLTDEQYSFYREKGNGHLEWFKKTQAAWIMADLDIIRRAKKPLPPLYLKSIAEEKFAKIWIALGDRLAADGAHLFQRLTPLQFAHFEEKLIEESEIFSQLINLPPKEYLEEFRDLQADGIDKMEDWVGSLTDGQEAKFIELTFVGQEQYQKEAAIWIEIRTEFIRQIKLKVKQGGVVEFLKSWARHPDIKGDKYKQYRKWRLARQVAVWVEMEKTITIKQRAYRSEQMATIIDDLKTMMATKYLWLK